jgi:mRNA interferase MazF
VHPQGTIVLVPFPFTDLSGHKRRPAVVVSPTGFHREDLILCAITSQIPPHLSRWEVALSPGDILGQRLPRPSVIQVGKLFTMHGGLILGRFAQLRAEKLAETLTTLRAFFSPPASRR